MAYAKDICEQIDKSNICQNGVHPKSIIKNALSGLALTMINSRTIRYLKIKKNIELYSTFVQNVAIIKSDNDVALLDSHDYVPCCKVVKNHTKIQNLW